MAMNFERMRAWMSGLLLTVVSGLATGAGALQAQSYSDNDWNVSFTDNCGFPIANGKAKSVQKIRQGGDTKIMVTLNPGDAGKCSTDAQPRNNAPYWERAELKQRNFLSTGAAYRIGFTLQMVQGFAGPRESFFQIHGHNQNCPAYPPVMLKFDGGRLQLDALRKVTQTSGDAGSKGQHKIYVIPGLTARSFSDAPHTIELQFDARTRPGSVSVAVDGRQVLAPVPVEWADCAKPHVKFGIYRPGKGRATSSAIFDDFKVSALK